MELLKSVEFPNHGEGTLLLTERVEAFSIYITKENPSRPEPGMFDSYIALKVDQEICQFFVKYKEDEEESRLMEKYGEKVGADKARIACYWYSYDRVGTTVKYGKGYTMNETTLLTGKFSTIVMPGEPDRIPSFFKPEGITYAHVFHHPSEEWIHGLIDEKEVVQLLPRAFVSNCSPFVKDSDTVTLFDLDRNLYVFSSTLPRACQELYGNIKRLQLENTCDPAMKLSDAIRYSLNTEGCLLNKTIKEKQNEFGDNAPKNMTYLRITLGPDERTGPGIPYVLEIWPSGHMSPVHNHGGACAIIKVLFGRITADVYNMITDPPEEDVKPVKTVDFKEGDITWISPQWFQTHMLRNRTDDFCATIQCYRYEEGDEIRWPAFDYVSPGDGQHTAILDQFYPNSDFSFVKLRSLVFEEYRKYLSGM